MFDSICKFLAENFSEDLASWLLGSPVRLTELSPQELSLEPIRADSLILLQSDDLVLQKPYSTSHVFQAWDVEYPPLGGVKVSESFG